MRVGGGGGGKACIKMESCWGLKILNHHHSYVSWTLFMNLMLCFKLLFTKGTLNYVSFLVITLSLIVDHKHIRL